MSDCLNLETLYPEYRIRMSMDHEKGHERDPWDLEIPCARFKARISPHGGTRLQAYVSTRNIWATLARLAKAGGTPFQVGDTEGTVLFEAADFDRIAAVLKPRRKRPAPSHFFGQKPAPTQTFERQTRGSDEKPGGSGQEAKK